MMTTDERRFAAIYLMLTAILIAVMGDTLVASLVAIASLLWCLASTRTKAAAE